MKIDKNKIKKFLKPTKWKTILFILMSLIFPTFQIIKLYIQLVQGPTFIFPVFAAIILLTFSYIGTYIISCFLAYLHQLIFPKKNWNLFIAIFLVILLLANIPGIGTTSYEVTPRPVFCQTIGAPCPQPECPPDCCYSTKVRQVFWPWKKHIEFSYCPLAYYKETFIKTIPIIGLFKFERSYNYCWEIIGGTIFEEFLGTGLLLGLTFFYWYLISSLLSHLIVFNYNKLRKTKK